METIIAYKTFDGTIFEDRVSAENYEREHIRYRGWDQNGAKTTNVDAIIYLYLETENDADAFIHDCDITFSPRGGIVSGDTGLFYWDDITEEYLYLCSGGYAKTLLGILQQITTKGND